MVQKHLFIVQVLIVCSLSSVNAQDSQLLTSYQYDDRNRLVSITRETHTILSIGQNLVPINSQESYINAYNYVLSIELPIDPEVRVIIDGEDISIEPGEFYTRIFLEPGQVIEFVVNGDHPGILVSSGRVEDLVKDIVLIPGSGEVVYDTNIITKKTAEVDEDGLDIPGEYITSYINMNNSFGVADVLLSLDNLQATFPNLERVSLVVAGFSTSKFLNTSRVVPKVENGPSTTEYLPYDWSYGSITRRDAEIVKRRFDGTLNYGGRWIQI